VQGAGKPICNVSERKDLPTVAKISQIAPAPVVWGRVCQWPK
jgi:hypothetical protein